MLGKMIAENRCGIQRLHLGGNKLSNFPCVLENAAILRELNLEDNPLSEECARSLLRALRDNKVLRVINLQKCGVTEAVRPKKKKKNSLLITFSSFRL